jgi:hypothetical protein
MYNNKGILMETEIKNITDANGNGNKDDKLTFEKVWLALMQTRDLIEKSSLETDKKFHETNEKFQETDKYLKNLGKEIGGLGNKFGTFNEGLVMPSLVQLFKTKFGCKSISENFRFFANGNSMEIDLLAVSNDSCFIIEIKSHLKEDAIEQVKNQIEKFRKNMKEYSDKSLFAVLVATHYDKTMFEKVSENGIYFISISDDLVKLKVPKNFKPKEW